MEAKSEVTKGGYVCGNRLESRISGLNKIFSKRFSFVLTAILVVSVFAAFSFVAIPSVQASPDPATIYVNTTGWWREGGTFNSSSTPIQAAIDNATSGDTINVAAGTYTENIVVNKSVSIVGSGSDSCIVQAADPNNHVF